MSVCRFTVFLALLHNHCYQLICIMTIGTYTTGDRAEMTRQLGSCTVKKASACTRRVSANCHNANYLVSATVVTGTGRKPDVPRSPAQMARFDGEIMDLFSSRSPREEEEVSLLGRS